MLSVTPAAPLATPPHLEDLNKGPCYGCGEAFQRLFATAPVFWRVQTLIHLRVICLAFAAGTVTLGLVLQLLRPADEQRDLFVSCRIIAMFAAGLGAWFTARSRDLPRISESVSWISCMVMMAGSMVAACDVVAEVRIVNSVRTFTLFCFGCIIMGWSPFYLCLFQLAAISMLIIVLTFFVPPPVAGIGGDILHGCFNAFFAMVNGVVLQSLLLRLYFLQGKNQEELSICKRLIQLTCDISFPLFLGRRGRVHVGEACRNLDSLVGKRILAGESIDNFLLSDSAENLAEALSTLGPKWPLMVPVIMHTASGRMVPAEFLVLRSDTLSTEPGKEGQVETRFLVGVKQLRPSDEEGEAQESMPLSVESPNTVNAMDSNRQSETGYTTKTGMIFGQQANIQASWRKVVQLGRKEHWNIGGNLLTLHSSKLLGSGGFGLVCEGSYCGAKVAIKFPRKNFSTTDSNEGNAAMSMLADYVQELRLLRIAKHPNIVIFYGAFLAPDFGELALILEKMEGPTLDRFILSGDVESEFKACILLDVSHAMVYLHSLRPAIVHGDLKPGNVFVEVREGEVISKIADFGLARRVTRSAADMGGTLRWAAPELVFGNKKPSMAADIYSLGQLMYFILTALRPYQGLSHSQIHDAMRKGRDPTEHWPQGGFNLMLKPVVDHCRRADPVERIPAVALAELLETAASPGSGKRSGDKENMTPKSLPGVISEELEEDELLRCGLEVQDTDAVLCSAFQRAREEVTINIS